MSKEEKNKEIVSRYFDEYWVKRNTSIVDELCSEDFLISYPNHGAHRGKAAAKKMLDDFVKAFPDLSFRAYGPPMIAEGDYVAARWIGGGTHSGIAFDDFVVGELPTANTGKKIWFSGISIFTLKNGFITEEIAEEGGLSVLQQLGLVPGPKAGKEIPYDDDGNQIWPTLS